jgi:hypothetical protein
MLLSLAVLHVSSGLSSPSAIRTPQPREIITRDVAIIGGGSSGTHAAISLKDAGKSIIVVEKQARLGGHTETYTEPTSGLAVDYGVVIWHNTSTVRQYFERFGVPLTSLANGGPPRLDYDLRTGQSVNVTQPKDEAIGAALAKYLTFLSQYPLLDTGMFLPSPVPDDLALPFGEFVQKYNMRDLVRTFFFNNQGVGDMLDVPVLENQRVMGADLVTQLATNGLVTTARHNKSEIYGRAQAELLIADSLLLSSEVSSAKRTDAGVELVLKTATGEQLIRAKKLLISIPLVASSLAPFRLVQEEKDVFTRLVNTGYSAALVKNTGLADDDFIYNYAQDTPYNLPSLPGVYLIQPTSIPGVKAVYYGSSSSNATDAVIKADIIATLKRLQAANPTVFENSEPEFVVYTSHAPFYMQATPGDIKDGIYERMNALQGVRSTYWTVAAFRAQDSSSLWRFNEEVVLPMVLEGL